MTQQITAAMAHRGTTGGEETGQSSHTGGSESTPWSNSAEQTGTALVPKALRSGLMLLFNRLEF